MTEFWSPERERDVTDPADLPFAPDRFATREEAEKAARARSLIIVAHYRNVGGEEWIRRAHKVR